MRSVACEYFAYPDNRYLVARLLPLASRIQFFRALLHDRFEFFADFPGEIDDDEVMQAALNPLPLRSLVTPVGKARFLCAVVTGRVVIDALYPLHNAMHAALAATKTLAIGFDHPLMQAVHIEQIATLKHLHTLHVSRHGMGELGAANIAALHRLRVLHIASNQLRRRGIQHLAKLSRLQTLDVSDNGLDHDDARIISTLRSLSELHIDSNNVGPVGARHLVDLEALHTLSIHTNKLGIEGAAQVARMRGLVTLDIRANQILSPGALSLAKLPRLKVLRINGNEIGALGVTALAGMHLLKLDLSWSDMIVAQRQYVQKLLELPTFTVTGFSC